MPELSTPTTAVRTSFLDAMDEFVAEGRAGPDDHSMLGIELGWLRNHDRADPQVFETFVRLVRDQAIPTEPGALEPVPSTTLWWVEGAEYLGRISIRHRLTPKLHELHGHIGYDVRPTARRRGHATAMLAAALPVANQVGIESALITCDHDNVASRRVIERNGGVFEDQRGVKLRFWVTTARRLRSERVG
jgi:predicted acetyltransferase